jgi:hypothetical protein
MTLGNYSTKYGSSTNDALVGSNGQVVLGLAGNDQLTASGDPLTFIPILAGGLGDDTYIVPLGTFAAIIENGGSSADTVRLGFSATSSQAIIFTTDNRHLSIVDSSSRTGVTILDWKNAANRIESFVFTDQTVSYDFIANGLTTFPGYRGNFVVNQDPSSNGYLDPSTGLTPSSFNSFISDVSALALSSTTPTGLTLSEFKQNPSLYMNAIRD